MTYNSIYNKIACQYKNPFNGIKIGFSLIILLRFLFFVNKFVNLKEDYPVKHSFTCNKIKKIIKFIKLDIFKLAF